mgnify:CR=1 FL=1
MIETDEKLAVKKQILDFIERVALGKEIYSPAETEILPEMINLLFTVFDR